MPRVAVVFVFAFTLAASAATAQVSNVAVPGTSDPWLAGMPPGSTASGGDTAPAQSPVLVPGPVNIAAGGALTFIVTGEVSNTGVLQGLTPDGQAPASHIAGAENGIADVFAPLNSLIGIFLDNQQPNLAGPAPQGHVAHAQHTARLDVGWAGRGVIHAGAQHQGAILCAFGEQRKRSPPHLP